MAEVNEAWGKSISEALARHGLTYRGARAACRGIASHTWWKDWADNIVPTDYKRAQLALEAAFGRAEAIKCLQAGGLPVPQEWIESADPDELIRRYVIARRGKLDRSTMLKRIQEIIDEEAREPEGFDPDSGAEGGK